MNEADKFMLIGEVGAGKTTLLNALFGKDEDARKTQAIEFESNGIDTPGEYFSHPRLYSALLCAAGDVATLVYMHPADRLECRLPPGFLDVYANKRVIGVITKTDTPDANPAAVEEILRTSGIPGPYFRLAAGDETGLAPLRKLLLNQKA